MTDRTKYVASTRETDVRTILNLIEPGNLYWSFTAQYWMVRAGTKLWIGLNRYTDPMDPPEWIAHERDDVATEIVERPVVDDGPIRIRVRDRRAEWRQRMVERHCGGAAQKGLGSPINTIANSLMGWL